MPALVLSIYITLGKGRWITAVSHGWRCIIDKNKCAVMEVKDRSKGKIMGILPVYLWRGLSQRPCASSATTPFHKFALSHCSLPTAHSCLTDLDANCGSPGVTHSPNFQQDLHTSSLPVLPSNTAWLIVPYQTNFQLHDLVILVLEVAGIHLHQKFALTQNIHV